LRRIFGILLSIAGWLVIAAACISGGLAAADYLGSQSWSQIRDFLVLIVAAWILFGAFGVALVLIGRRLRNGDALSIPPSLRAFLASPPIIALELVAAVVMWAVAAWFTAYIVESVVEGPASDLGFNLLLGIPLGVLIPAAAGFALYAATRVGRAPGPEGTTHEASRLLGNALAAFGVFWVVFAGVCTATGGFSGNPSELSLMDPAVFQEAALSFAFGSIFAIVGLWLRAVSR
jgi:hypothetical protein